MKSSIHYVLILDKSGSMNDLKKEVILSFNEQVEMILKLKEKEPGSTIKITLCTFNDKVDFKFVDTEIGQLKKLTAADYKPNSLTALYDAMGSSFLKISEIIAKDDQVYFAIFTDGLENSSSHYSAGDIKMKLEEAEKMGWKVNFFCRYEDKSYYKNNLNLDDKYITAITLDAPGIKAMEDKISYSLNSMISEQKKEKSPQTGG